MKSYLELLVVSSIVSTAIGQDDIAYAPIPQAPIPIDRSKLLECIQTTLCTYFS